MMKWPRYSQFPPLKAVAALCIAAFLAGCVGQQPVQYQEASKAEIVAMLKTAAASLPGYRAEATLDIKAPDLNRSESGWFAFQLPLSLRLELESWGYEFLLVSDGLKAYMVTPEKNEGGKIIKVVYEGAIDGDYAFRPVDIISALGLMDVTSDDDVRIEKYADHYELVFLGPRSEEGGIRKRVWLERVHWHIERVQTFAGDGSLFMEANLSRYEPVKSSGGEAVMVAHDIRIEWPQAKTTVRFRFKSIDDKVDPRMFIFDPLKYDSKNGYEWRKIP
jgi:outer membrane lipoprotein-sorting protein